MRGLREGKQGDWRRPCTSQWKNNHSDAFVGLTETKFKDQMPCFGEPLGYTLYQTINKLKEIGLKLTSRSHLLSNYEQIEGYWFTINHLRAYMRGKLRDG